ncbi:hypothetical protein [Bradyrhizobium canariense]|uniref:hypothetical protein n=1 Tax=Bradyrhizobium canariense TaxID=255045 RepID=UPI001B8A687B|nr:hypothetical protein [Bradyrhizobium canariense]MBR0952484.1 hypothetical protein [Bradyrhizobium canariense]
MISFHKYLFEAASPSIGILRAANAEIVKTHVVGSLGEPKHEWKRVDADVLSCNQRIHSLTGAK